ncbi:MAG: hypothetical protein ACFB01_16320 [Cohaesibacteraceae bacterium]
MSETNEAQTEFKVVPMVSRAGRLSDALKRARAREQARRRDQLAVREGRLSALAYELRSIADELPAGETERFALLRADGQERLIVDSLSYVDLHPETLDYRLVRQRRDGPDVLAEIADRDVMADRVADYVADQIVEHEAMGAVSAPAETGPSQQDENGPDRSETETPDRGRTEPSQPSRMGFWPGFWLFVLGGVCSATALFAYAWISAGQP